MPNWQLQHTGSVYFIYGQNLPRAHRVCMQIYGQQHNSICGLLTKCLKFHISTFFHNVDFYQNTKNFIFPHFYIMWNFINFYIFPIILSSILKISKSLIYQVLLISDHSLLYNFP